METVKRAKARGNAVVMGQWVVLETAQETTLDVMCAEIEAAGGVVFEIVEVTTQARTGRGKRTNIRRFIVQAAVPNCPEFE